MLEAALVDARADFSPDAAGHGVLVQDQGLAGFLDAGHHEGFVPWQQGPQVNQLHVPFRMGVEHLLRPLHAESVGDDGRILPSAHGASHAKLQQVIFLCHGPGQAPVEVFVLKEQDGVGIVNGHAQQAFGVCGRGRVGNLEAWHVEEPRLGALAVVGACAHAAPCRHPHDNVRSLSPTPVDLGEVVDDLVEAAGDEVAELHFHHGLLAGNRQAKASADDGRFAQRSVAHTLLAKGVDEPIGHFEDTAVRADILAHEHEAWMLLHACAQPLRDGVDEPHLTVTSIGCLFQSLRCSWSKAVVQFLRGVRLDLGLCSGAFQPLVNEGLELRPEGFFLGVVEHSLRHEMVAQTLHGVDLAPRVDQAFWVVLRAGCLFVTSDSERFEFKYDRSRFFTQRFNCVLDLVVHVEQVISIDLNGVLFRDAVPHGFVGEVGTTELLFARGGQAPGVVFNPDDDGQLPHGCDVDCFVKVAFRGTAVPCEHEGTSSAAVKLFRKGHAVRQSELGTEVADHAHNFVLGASKVKTAVPALGEPMVLALKL